MTRVRIANRFAPRLTSALAAAMARPSIRAFPRIGGATPMSPPRRRFKPIRDRRRNDEYVLALDKAGQGAYARWIARSFTASATTFNNDPAAMALAREQLGARLHRLALGP